MKQHQALAKYKLSLANCQLSIILLAVAFFASPLKAQVNIGSDATPKPFSILELTTTTNKGGLRLPQLTDQQCTDLKPALIADPTAAEGLVVYNTGIDCIEYWTNNDWVSLCGPTAPLSVILTTPAGSAAQTVCASTPITNIVYLTSGAGVTGATTTGLPSGVTGSWSSNVYTLSGTPTATGTFNYTVTTTGGTGSASITGSITVAPPNTITLTSAAATRTQSLPEYFLLDTISYSTSGTVGAYVTGLPSGLVGYWDNVANRITISGSPTVTGTFNYTVVATGGCEAQATGTITVGPAPTAGVITGTASVCPSGKEQTYSIVPVTGATNYEWTWPAGWTVASSSTVNQNSITLVPGYVPGAIVKDGVVNNGVITVKAQKGDIVFGVPSTLNVTTYGGCCAYMGATDWSKWMCYNLGANESLNDPFTYVSSATGNSGGFLSTDDGSAGIEGGLFQWGRKMDGHEKWNSPKIAGPVTDPNADPGQFITTTTSASFQEWLDLSVWTSNFSTISNLWTGTPKGPNDPCPDGWRLPSSYEYSLLFSDGSTTTYDISTVTWTSHGMHFGNALYLPYLNYVRQNDGQLINFSRTYGLALQPYWTAAPPLNFRTGTYYGKIFLFLDPLESSAGGQSFVWVGTGTSNWALLALPVRCIDSSASY